MKNLGSLYSDFDLVDIDAQGGFARVASVTALDLLSTDSQQCAFKVMRPVEKGSDWNKRFNRFVEEITLLSRIFDDKSAPADIVRMLTPIYDFGFVSVELMQALSQFKKPDQQIEIRQTDKISTFIELGKQINSSEPEKWCPYIVEEKVDFNDSLLRQIIRRPASDLNGLYRLPTGEVLYLAICLLNLIEYLYRDLDRAYLDWKPEHIYWNGKARKIKLIDWNITLPLEYGLERDQNIKDDLRNFCGAVIYTGLTMVDISAGKPVAPRPSTASGDPTTELRDRWSTEDPIFYQTNNTLDESIKSLIRYGLNPNLGYASPQELREKLMEYSKSEGMEIDSSVGTSSYEYWQALERLRSAQDSLHEAHNHLVQATLLRQGTGKPMPMEYSRVSQALRQTFNNLLMP